jgi:DNA anti-recombination protein RmuC
MIEITLILLFICIAIFLTIMLYNKTQNIKNLQNEKLNLITELEGLKTKEQFYLTLSKQLDFKNSEFLNLSNENSKLKTELQFRPTKEDKAVLENKIDLLNRELIKLQEKLSSQSTIESNFKDLLNLTKEEITNQNRSQYSAIANDLKQYTERQTKEMHKETEERFEKIIEKDVKETMGRIQKNLQLQNETLISHQKPIEFFTQILSGSKESGTHGEQTIVNQLDNMGLKYGIDYFTQISGSDLEGERLIADVVILIPNSGKKDVIIVDSKSSTKLGSDAKSFLSSVEASFTVFAKKNYKSAVEKKLKELNPNIKINQTHLFVYLPFDRMLSRISEEKPLLLQKIREKDIGILTPVILDFLLDTIKLYSAKLEFNDNSEKIMQDVKSLIERTAKVLTLIKDVGKSIDNTSKKYSDLQSSVFSRFVPIVNKTAKALDVKPVHFDKINEETLKEIEVKDEGSL